LADLIVERIVARTQDGLDREGKKFKKYSPEYIKSLDFEIAGKSKGDINLTLSGDMLAALKPLKITDSQIVIGFDNGTEENARADGNIRGTYGKPTPDKSKARDFLGITRAELRDLLKEVT